MNKTIKIIFFTILFFIMLATTFWAGFQQNLLTDFGWTTSPMWFKATLVDFYLNQLILFLWVWVLEDNFLIKLIWFVLFICFGSMGTALYIIIRLVQNKPLLKKEKV
ncbi:DUF1475 domain-containing protein [Bacteriovoracaceae bacterium]|nr:DUF1475 domain-containing protein [Bacteriovoracaceae bacterium]